MLRFTGFLLIPLTTLCDNYIERPRLAEQKNNPIWAYSYSPIGGDQIALEIGTIL